MSENICNRNILDIANKTPQLSDHQLSFMNNETEPISKFRRALPQFIAVSVNNVILIVYGMVLGFPIVIIPAIQLGHNYRNNDLFLNKDEIIWLSTISLTCVPFGSIVSGFYCEYIGKKRGLQLINIPIIISFLLYHFATTPEHLYLALGLSSLSCGLIETPIILYIAETVEPKYRGCLIASGSIFILLGIIFQYYICSILHWRMVAAILTLFPVISIILLFFIPETAVWLIRQNNLLEAIKSLRWFRGWVSENMIEREFLEIYDRINKCHLINSKNIEEKRNALNCYIQKLTILKRKILWYPFMLILFIFFVGHFSGKTPLRTYIVQIFHTLKAPLKKYEATMLLNLFEILGASFCVVLLQYIGKRKLIFISSIGTAICFFGAATYSYFLYKIPGYSVDNVVSDVAQIPNQNIITIKNITEIFNHNSEHQLGKNKNTEVESRENYDFSTNLYNTTNITIGEYPIETERKYDYNNEINMQKEELFDGLVKITENEKGRLTIQIPKQEENNLLFLPLILLFSAVFFAHIGIKTIPWILIGEIFPEEIRSYVAGLTSGFGFFFGFLANYFFLDMVNYLSITGTFLFFSVIAIYGTTILYFTLPETENESLKDIEIYFQCNEFLHLHNIRK
ncbi:facilitated trehalose transporter Tret1 [Condylostylus longicornis]|uniref:facilitated trehalose transporter Tret1 n=1 Tax=Condylostylus longicornis TaxID=2530218 RepID=UPI00244DA380|nr:facilitated trehalose transporter Tret1 [Condylostylus longicornis]